MTQPLFMMNCVSGMRGKPGYLGTICLWPKFTKPFIFNSVSRPIQCVYSFLPLTNPSQHVMGPKSCGPLLSVSYTCDSGQTVPLCSVTPVCLGLLKDTGYGDLAEMNFFSNASPQGKCRDWEDVALHGVLLSCSRDSSCLGQTAASPYSMQAASMLSPPYRPTYVDTHLDIYLLITLHLFFGGVKAGNNLQSWMSEVWSLNALPGSEKSAKPFLSHFAVFFICCSVVWMGRLRKYLAQRCEVVCVLWAKRLWDNWCIVSCGSQNFTLWTMAVYSSFLH